MRWTFGVEPLGQTTHAARRLRRVIGLLLSVEHEQAALDGVDAALDAIEHDLEALVPPSPVPRVGAAVDGDGRAYLDHSRDIGAYNPCFPEYDIVVDGDRAAGSVSFPIAYEGPPGIVHGGFLALFADCVVQHHNCDLGVAGKTTSLALRFRRPTPLLVDLAFDVARTVDGDRISSVVTLRRDDVVLVAAEVGAIAGDRAGLPPVSPRRADR